MAVDGELLPPGEDYTIPKFNPRVETSIRAASLRIYLHDSDDYDACCQVVCYGDKGWMHSITGAGFYMAIDKVIGACKKLGLREVSGYVRPAHARLAKRQAEKLGIEFEQGEPGMMDGHYLVWGTWRW